MAWWNAIDEAMMHRCIELSKEATREGDYPFGALVAIEGDIVAEAGNRAMRDADFSRHAEIIAIAAALKTVGRGGLARATLYSTVEPCAMCSFCIREAWVGRVAYALASPAMGGVSKWTILQDAELGRQLPIFGPAPEVVSGLLAQEAMDAWREWNPVATELARLRGALADETAQKDEPRHLPAHSRSMAQRVVLPFLRLAARREKHAQLSDR
ncbi:nucleoside deaminase [Rhodomicrobium sp. Az07]|uniref:nucleoside deaminase n=1 Tax=Rhodomicrobium sp. Az07 TaxID=2839034 RepID=UPI001BE798E0|nr:nucleoside deaminase [Rhodomicrobium sp. Az07]MBT3071287.1 nucleoside deaminase [Rhodomicrobium sp. Az07]